MCGKPYCCVFIGLGYVIFRGCRLRPRQPGLELLHLVLALRQRRGRWDWLQYHFLTKTAFPNTDCDSDSDCMYVLSLERTEYKQRYAGRATARTTSARPTAFPTASCVSIPGIQVHNHLNIKDVCETGCDPVNMDWSCCSPSNPCATGEGGGLGK